MQMPQNWFFLLYNKITTVEARRLLRQLDVSAYPHVDERSRERIHNRMLAASGYMKIQEEQKATNNYETGWDILRSLGRKK